MYSQNHYEYLLRIIDARWHIVTIEEIGEIISGGTPSRSISTFWHGNIYWITPTDISKNNTKFIADSNEKISLEGLTHSSARLLPKNSLVVTSRATLGLVALSKVPLATNQGFKNIVFFKHSYPDFYYYFFYLLSDELRRLSSGSTFDEISKRDFSKIRVPIPPLPEQRRIAEILDTLDEAIQETERLIAKLRDIKTGLLHDLLTCGIDEHGNLRDPVANPEQFKDSPLGRVPKEWEVKTIDEICTLGRGRVISNLELAKNSGIYPVYSSQSKNDGVFGYLNTFDFDGEYVTWTTDGAYAGTVFYRQGQFNCTNVCGILKSRSSDLHLKYLKLELSTRTQSFVSYVGNPKLMNNVVAAISVVVPPYKEQQKISSIIDLHDTRIHEEEAYCAKLKDMKRGLMEDLLTGTVRVQP